MIWWKSALELQEPAVRLPVTDRGLLHDVLVGPHHLVGHRRGDQRAVALAPRCLQGLERRRQVLHVEALGRQAHHHNGLHDLLARELVRAPVDVAVGALGVGSQDSAVRLLQATRIARLRATIDHPVGAAMVGALALQSATVSWAPEQAATDSLLVRSRAWDPRPSTERSAGSDRSSSTRSRGACRDPASPTTSPRHPARRCARITGCSFKADAKPDGDLGAAESRYGIRSAGCGSHSPYIDITNAHPKPFIWTKTADEILASVARLCQRISNSGR